MKLRSDGPNMTVADVGDYSFSDGIENGVKCNWFVNMERFTEVFDEEVLTKV